MTVQSGIVLWIGHHRSRFYQLQETILFVYFSI
jgi:hypothetical protein